MAARESNGSHRPLAPPQPGRSRARQHWNGLVALVRKEVVRVTRIWVQTIVPPMITTTLYFLIFGSIIGRRVGTMGGFDYMQYIAPGLVMMSVITNAYGNVVSSFFGAKLQKHLEELLVSPLPPTLIVLGYAIGGMLRGTVIGLMVSAVAFLFTPLDVAHPLLALLLVALTAFVFALGGLVNAVYAQNFDHTSIVPNFVLTPLTYLGGVFYSVTLLAEPWQTLSHFNPILYMVNGLRFAVLGVSDVDPLTAVVMVVVFAVVLFTTCVVLLRRGTGIRA